MSSTSSFRLYYCWKKSRLRTTCCASCFAIQDGTQVDAIDLFGTVVLLVHELRLPTGARSHCIWTISQEHFYLRHCIIQAVECPDIGPYDPLGNLIPEVLLAYLHGFLLRGRFFTLHAKVSPPFNEVDGGLVFLLFGGEELC